MWQEVPAPLPTSALPGRAAVVHNEAKAPGPYGSGSMSMSSQSGGSGGKRRAASAQEKKPGKKAAALAAAASNSARISNFFAPIART